jgi:SulP family sulfate permease
MKPNEALNTYPVVSVVIAGFLSGIGLQLMNNGLHMSSSLVFTRQVFTVQQLLLLFPALCFVALTRRAKHRNWPVAMSFPVILIASFVGFHIVTLICGNSMEELQTAGWVFEWSAQVVAQSPMWHPWTSIDFGLIQWGVLAQEGVSFTVPLVILGAIKYSVAATSLSTVFSRDISADNEMKIVGVANLLCGALGSCGGCHYLPAMGIMKQIAGHEKVPAVVCSVLLLLLWVQGIQLLELVPKFIFGGLLLSVGMTFLDSFFFAPLQFLKPMEVAVLGFITSSFLVIGMLESVSLGILISMIELLYYIHQVGCVYLETTGITMQSATPRSSDELTALQVQGDAIFILRLQGFLFFGTSAKILKRIKRRVEKAELQQVQFVVLDFSLVPNFDARALLNLRKVSSMTDKFGFDIHLCGLTPQIEIPLRRNHTYSSRVHFRPGFDATLRVCEDQLLERANHGL